MFGKRLKQARELRGMTQEELVSATGLRDRTGLSAIENGKRDIGVTELPTFAAALKIPISFFFAGEIRTADDQEAALLEWFRTLSKDRKDRVFEYVQDQANRELLIIGERRDPKRSSPDKGRREDD